MSKYDHFKLDFLIIILINNNVIIIIIIIIKDCMKQTHGMPKIMRLDIRGYTGDY